MCQQKSDWLFLLIPFFTWFSQPVSGQTPYPDVEICMSNETARRGDTACIQFMVKNFIDVEGFGFQISFNSNILKAIAPVRFPDPRVGDDLKSSLSVVQNAAPLGRILFNYYGDAITLPDDIVIFELCFEVIGNPGDVSPVFINEIYSDTGIIRPLFIGQGNVVQSPFNYKNGSVTVVSNQLTITRNICDATNAPNYNNGILEFYFGGGTQPYSYSVVPGPSGSGILPGQRIRLENLTRQTYTINVTDALGVMTSINAVVSDNLPYTYTLSKKDPDCSNRDIKNGNAIITINDPGSYNRDDFRYEWSNFVFNTPNNTSLPNGKYYVTIIDPSGCRAYDSTEIFRQRIDVELTVIKEESCPGQGDGEVRLTTTGGLPFFNNRYDVRVDGLPIGRFPSPTVINSIRGGNRFINVIDSLNCFETIEFFMPTKVGILIDTLFLNPVRCFNGNSGSISIRAREEGNTNFSFVLRQGTTILFGGIASNDTYTMNNLPAGSYSITINSVGTGCTRIFLFDITEPGPIDLNNTAIINPSCQTNIGSITVVPSGGTSPYMYRWSHDVNAITNSVGGLAPGSYTLTVTDANNCTSTSTYVLIFDGMGTAPLTNATVTTPISCFGGSDGVINVDVFPANPNTTYTWRLLNQVNVISTQQSVANLSSGTYVVLVSNGTCTVLDTVVLPNPPGMEVTFNTVQPTCPGLNDGSIGAIVSGGNPGYTYQWFRQGTTNALGVNSVLAPIGAGTYDLILVDAKLCRKDTFVTLDNPAKIELDLLAVNQVNCFGFSNGRAEVIATGGTSANPVFSYLWSTSPVDSGTLADHLPAGRNWVIAFDNVCVSDTLYFDVPTVQKLRLTTTTQSVDPTCFGFTNGSINASAQGGIETGYRFRWQGVPNGDTSVINNLGAGKYYVDITDATGCTARDSVILTQPDQLVVNLNPLATQLLSCRSMDSGQIGVIATGGNPGIITFNWNFQNQTGNIISGLSAGNYCVTATDSKGCLADYCYTLISPPPVIGRVSNPAEPPCFGQKTNLCIDFISGGTGNKYTFQINQGQRFPKDSCVALFAGTYTINLIDSAGCFIDTIITIEQPDPINITLPDDAEILLGEKSDLIIAQINSPFGIGNILWTPSGTDIIECFTPDCSAVIFSPISTTTFQVLVTDQNGCTAIDEIEIRVKDVRNVFFPNIFAPKEEGGRNGMNSYFNVAIGKGVTEVLSLEVYDRWGNKVFGKFNFVPDGTFTDGWDGTFHGQLLNSAVFAYRAVVLFSDGKEIPYTGAVTLVR